MNFCYVCGVELNDKNRSSEHIIPNALGGRLRSNKILCLNCNSLMGSKYDNIIAEQLNFIMVLLEIPRQRGDSPDIEVISETGEKFKMNSDRTLKMDKPIVNKTESGAIKSMVIQASQLNQTLKGLGKSVDKNNIKYEERKEDICTLEIKQEITEEIYPALLKIAIGYYFYINGDKSHVPRSTIDEVKNGNPSLKRFKCLANNEEFIANKPLGCVSHILVLFGNKKSKSLFCYVELFNFIKTIIVLNNNYTGDNFSEYYAYDLNNHCMVGITLDEEELYGYTQLDFEPFSLAKVKKGNIEFMADVTNLSRIMLDDNKTETEKKEANSRFIRKYIRSI